jgi:hypothetical protein
MGTDVKPLPHRPYYTKLYLRSYWYRVDWHNTSTSSVHEFNATSKYHLEEFRLVGGDSVGALVRTEVSDEFIASIIIENRIRELGTTLAVSQIPYCIHANYYLSIKRCSETMNIFMDNLIVSNWHDID